jgi:uncharacterized protein
MTAEIYRNTLIPDVVLTEVTYLLRREAGTRAVTVFLNALVRTNPKLIRVTHQTLRQSSNIMEQYLRGGTELDFVDCCIIASAERYNISRVCTLDRRDFEIVRLNNGQHLEILP